jgi:hypothetical protein
MCVAVRRGHNVGGDCELCGAWMCVVPCRVSGWMCAERGRVSLMAGVDKEFGLNKPEAAWTRSRGQRLQCHLAALLQDC